MWLAKEEQESENDDIQHFATKFTDHFSIRVGVEMGNVELIPRLTMEPNKGPPPKDLL